MTVQVCDQPARHRYEILVDGARAGFAAYRVVDANRWAFTHTEIARKYEHRGLGSVLIREAMADVQRRRIEVLPQCPFVCAYLSEHPELDVVPADVRQRFDL